MCRASSIILLSRMESSATMMGLLRISRKPRLSISAIWMVVWGAISATIFSKSRMVTRSSPHWAMPVATPSAPPETVLSGFWMSVQEMRMMRSTEWTRKAIQTLLKLVMTKISLGSFGLSPPRYLGRSTTVITVSRGLKMPSTDGWDRGMGFTGSEIMISSTLATLIPYKFPLMVNFMISISLVPDSSKTPCLSSFMFRYSLPFPALIADPWGATHRFLLSVIR